MTSNLQLMILKKFTCFPVKFYRFFDIKTLNLNPDPQLENMLDPDPQ